MFNTPQNKQKLRPLRFIRKHFEWRTYIETHFDSIKEANAGAELRVHCPSCDDHKHKCYVNPEKGLFHCFKCPFSVKKNKYDVFDFVALTENIGKFEAMRRLTREYTPVTPEDWEAALAGELDEVPEQPRKFKHSYLTGLPKVAKKFGRGNSNAGCALPFWDYLTGRGLEAGEITDLLQAHYIPDRSHEIFDHKGNRKGDIGRRILWPIYGGDNKLVSWQARAWEGDDFVKYFNAPDTDISATLWPYVPPRPGSTVILCEGVLDCVALRRLPKEYSAYACFSKHITRDQIKLLKGKVARGGRTTAYVCQQGVCKLPVTDVEAFRAQVEPVIPELVDDEEGGKDTNGRDLGLRGQEAAPVETRR